jgi:RHS repeat-associated protein
MRDKTEIAGIGFTLKAPRHPRLRTRSLLTRGLGALITLLSLAAALPAVSSAAECTNTWTGSAEGTWTTAANWSAGHVPTESDVACIGSGKTVNVNAGTNQVGVVQGEGSLKILGSTLEMMSTTTASSIKALTIKSNGVLSGPATLKISATLTWSGESTMSGSGSTVILPAATATKNAASTVYLKQRHLVNEGTFTETEASISESEGAELLNAGTFNCNTGVTPAITSGAGGSSIVNTGTFQKTAGVPNTVAPPFENRGSVISRKETLSFIGGGSGSGSASLWEATTGGKVQFAAGSFAMSGGKLVGNIAVEESATTLSLEGAGVEAAQIAVAKGTLNVVSGESITVSTLTMNLGAILEGAGTLKISNSLAWSKESTMSDSGSTVILPAATATKSAGSTVYLKQRRLVNEGTFTATGASITESEGAELLNSGTFNCNTGVSNSILAGSGVSSVVNTGTFRKTAGVEINKIEPRFENKGVVESQLFALAFSGGGSAGSTALWEATKGAKIRFSGGTFAMGASRLVGVIPIEESGTVVNLENANIEAAQIEVTKGSLNFAAGSTSLSTLALKTGATVEDAGNLNVASLTLAGGLLTGSGSVNVSSAFTWSQESKMSGSGSTVIQSSAVASKEAGGIVYLKQRRLINNGKFTATNGQMSESEGAEIVNEGTFNSNMGVTSAILAGAGGSSIVNDGVFQKTAGVTNVIEPTFHNHGQIRELALPARLEIIHPAAVAQSEEFGKRCNCGDPVETATGDFSENQTDFMIGGRGVGLDLVHTYSAQAAAAAPSAGSFGYGWSGSFSDHLAVEESGAKVTLTQGDGSTIPFSRVSGTTYSGPAWSQETLSGSPEAGYTFTRTDQTQLRFSGAGRLESVADRNGNETTLSYDEAGRLKTIADPAGRQITLSYNAGGQVEGAEDPTGHVVKYAYESGNLASVTMPGEESPRWKFKYDASHRMTSMTDGRGGKTTNEYDSSNRVTSQTDPTGRTLTFKYEAFHTTVTNKATGAVTDEWFTSNNEPFSITRGYGTAAATTETFSYNEAGRLTAATDGNGHTTSYGYDPEGNRTSEHDAAGHETKWTFNGTHDVFSMTTPGGETTTLERDAKGNVESISRPAPGETAQTTAIGYNAYGEPETITDPLKRTWTYGYDSQGDRTSETDPAGDTQTLAYDEDSRLTSLVSPRGNVEGAEASEYTTAIERDAQGRRKKVTDPLGHSVEYAYDANGNLAARTDANGHTTKYSYDADNEPIKTEEPNGATTETGYDGSGQIVSQTDGNKHTTTYVRNVLEQPVEAIDPLGRKTVEEFDAAGNLKAAIDPAERKTSYSYDAANRLVEVNYSKEATLDVKFGYDAEGSVTSMIDGTGESSYSYDQLDRLTRSEDGHGDVVGYGYDLGEEVTGIAYPNGKEISRTFDPAGRLESVTDWLSGKTTFAYNADSGLEGISFPAGSGNVDEYSYDRIDRMSGATFAKGAETLASLSYGRDKAGQVVSDLSQGLPGPEELAYGYDANARLTAAGEAGYEYDASDNLTKAPGTTNTYDAGSQLEAGTGVLYSYDKLGERTKATPEAGPATTYAYNQAGDLTSVERPEEGEIPAIAESFAYDGNGLMASRTSGFTTRYLTWDRNATLPLILNDGQNSYIYGPGGLPIEQVSAEESPTYLHHDQLGSTRLLTSSSGETIGAFTYGAYGELEGQAGSATTPMGFAGQYTDAQSGLQYLRARFYDPSTAQFMTLDPILPLTRSPYDYARDNPLNRVDPRGLCGAGSINDVLESFNPISEENCAYQGSEALNDATGIDPREPAVVDAGVTATCLAPVADVICGGALAGSFLFSTSNVVHEGVETHFCEVNHLAAEEAVNAVMFGFGGLGLKTAGMMAGAPFAAKAVGRGGPAAAQGMLDAAEGRNE